MKAEERSCFGDFLCPCTREPGRLSVYRNKNKANGDKLQPEDEVEVYYRIPCGMELPPGLDCLLYEGDFGDPGRPALLRSKIEELLEKVPVLKEPYKPGLIRIQ